MGYIVLANKLDFHDRDTNSSESWEIWIDLGGFNSTGWTAFLAALETPHFEVHFVIWQDTVLHLTDWFQWTIVSVLLMYSGI
jgi:hypothetical protein